MAKKPSGYYSKEARHARKSAACAKCQAQAAALLIRKPRKVRAPKPPRAPRERKPRMKRVRKLKGAPSFMGTKLRFNEAGEPIAPRKKYRRRSKITAADMVAPW